MIRGPPQVSFSYPRTRQPYIYVFNKNVMLKIVSLRFFSFLLEASEPVVIIITGWKHKQVYKVDYTQVRVRGFW